MALKMDASDIAALGAQSSFSVDGVQETAAALRDVRAMVMMVTTLVSSAAAEGIFIESQKHVPYDTGELYQSGFWGPVGAALGGMGRGLTGPVSLTGNSIQGNYSPSVDALLTGAGDYNAILPALSPTMRIGSRMYTRYAVGYTAEHAVLVHENVYHREWNQDTNSPHPDVKWDHFLFKAYQAHVPYFSSAVAAGIALGLKAVEVKAAKTMPRGLGNDAGTARPRLVRPGGR